MAKFDRMVAKFTAETYTNPELIKDSIEQLKEIREALQEGMTHYADQEKLNNWHEPWYSNARESYENKVEKVDGVILSLEARLVGLQTP